MSALHACGPCHSGRPPPCTGPGALHTQTLQSSSVSGFDASRTRGRMATLLSLAAGLPAGTPTRRVFPSCVTCYGQTMSHQAWGDAKTKQHKQNHIGFVNVLTEILCVAAAPPAGTPTRRASPSCAPCGMSSPIRRNCLVWTMNSCWDLAC
jgi:hypothetical protein